MMPWARFVPMSPSGAWPAALPEYHTGMRILLLIAEGAAKSAGATIAWQRHAMPGI